MARQGILEELDGVGIAHLGGEADADKTVTLASGQLMEHDKDVAAVVVGFDRNVNYYKIQYATLCIRENPGCEFIATNTDAVTHLTDAARSGPATGRWWAPSRGRRSASPPSWQARAVHAGLHREQVRHPQGPDLHGGGRFDIILARGRTAGSGRCWCSRA